ncbi:transposase [Coraliomargarita algicola]|uniref:transposase n=1 Tax=Coraliomargarita algicola TaxID=3092156 RepID=UPI003CE580C8
MCAALSFVLIIGSPDRFATARDVGPFLGLVPGRDQSGDVDKPMRITKAGNRMMRRLLVSFKPNHGDTMKARTS